MTHTEIRRAPLSKPTEPCALSLTLADEAAALLGYRASASPNGKPSLLLEALATLDIQPLNGRDVLRYQVEQRHAIEREALEREIIADAPSRWNLQQTWQQLPIEKWTRGVPEHILLRAIQIKRALPGCELLVEYLAADPFLIVTLQTGQHSWEKETVYVDVWDEPTFERSIQW